MLNLVEYSQSILDQGNDALTSSQLQKISKKISTVSITRMNYANNTLSIISQIEIIALKIILLFIEVY